MKTSRRNKLFILTALLLLAYLTFWSPLPFVSSWWHSDNYRKSFPSHTRARIVDGLILTNRLDNLSQAEVEQLLGPSDKTSYFRDWGMVYNLGMRRGLIPIDDEWLVIRLDGMARVEDYRILED